VGGFVVVDVVVVEMGGLGVVVVVVGAVVVVVGVVTGVVGEGFNGTSVG